MGGEIPPIPLPGAPGFPAGAAFVGCVSRTAFSRLVPKLHLGTLLFRPSCAWAPSYDTPKAAAYEKSQAAGLGPGWLPAFRTQTSNQWPGNPRPPASMLNQ